MNDRSWLLERECELQALISEREGMLAANAARARSDQAPAYPESCFYENGQAFEKLAATIRAASGR